VAGLFGTDEVDGVGVEDVDTEGAALDEPSVGEGDVVPVVGALQPARASTANVAVAIIDGLVMVTASGRWVTQCR
jgi:hypothetical protein